MAIHANYRPGISRMTNVEKLSDQIPVVTNKKDTSKAITTNSVAMPVSKTQSQQQGQSVNQSKPGVFTYDPYKESSSVTQWSTALDAHNQNKPGQLQYDRQAEWDDIFNQIVNRKDFSYDLNGDALYQQYKNQYMTQGNQAMMDTMGQAAAMTGGYGNSYAQSVGQQTYQGHLQQLNDKVPELYRLALDKYNQEGKDLYNKYGLFQSDFDNKYSQHRDAVADWNAERDFLAGRYDSERDRDYGRYMDVRDFAYGQHRDDVADSQWSQQFAHQQAQDALAQDNWLKEFAHQQAQDALAQENWGKQFERQKEQDALAQINQARTNLENMILSGYTPTNKQIKAAGMTRGEVEALISAGQKGSDTISLSAVNSVIDKIDSSVDISENWFANMFTRPHQKIEEIISEAADNGDINEAEYNYLMDKYFAQK